MQQETKNILLRSQFLEMDCIQQDLSHDI